MSFATLREAPIIDDPFPYVIVHDLFPADVYRGMVANFPPKEQMRNMMKHYPNRYLLFLKNDDGFYGGAGQLSAFWTEFRDVQLKELRGAVEEKFNVKADTTGAILMRDIPGYRIGPHTDCGERIVTGLVYMPEDASRPECGTVLYRSEHSDPRGQLGDDHTLQGFEEVAVAPYLPNTALFFLKGARSWHGVEPCDIERRVISFDLQRK
jgi:hypothetical protein